MSNRCLYIHNMICDICKKSMSIFNESNLKRNGKHKQCGGRLNKKKKNENLNINYNPKFKIIIYC